MDDMFGWIIFIGVVLAIWYYDFNPFSDEIIVYQQQCVFKDNSKSKCEWINLRYITYNINYDTQTVLSWPSNNSYPVTKGKNCVVVSKKHWECGDGYYKYGFKDGDYIRKDTKNDRYVSKIKWWLN